MGAALAGLVSAFPGLIWLSQHKIEVFAVALFLLLAAGLMLWRARLLPCPADPRQAKLCRTLCAASWTIYGVSVVVFLTGGFFAFLAPAIL